MTIFSYVWVSVTCFGVGVGGCVQMCPFFWLGVGGLVWVSVGGCGWVGVGKCMVYNYPHLFTC